MEARLTLLVRTVAAAALCFSLSGTSAFGAGYRTTNFVVDAPTPQLAKEIGDSAERCRSELAEEWLGKQLPAWSKPCPIKVQVGPNMGAGGATSFVFDQGAVFGWRMNIQGSRERLLDSVLPHEVTHTIFASHFLQPLPRWADEGACTTVEHESEIFKQKQMLIEFLKTRPSRGIPFSAMFAMTEYPRDVMPLYAQGHALAQFLIETRGKREFLAFLGDGMRDENWPRAVEQHYGYRDLLALQTTWLDWVHQGRPAIGPGASGVLVASNNTVPIRPEVAPPIVRGQDPGTSERDAGPWAAVGPTPAAPGSRPPSKPWPGEVQQTASAAQLPSVYDTSRNRGTVLR